MKIIEKIKIFKKDWLYPDMLYSYPSWYLSRRIKSNINIDFIEWNSLLYIHIPFCIKLCSFCNVHKCKYENEEQIRKYLNIVYDEIDFFSRIIKWDIKWIYIWWWTPTILSADHLDELFKKIFKSFNFQKYPNIEIDAHPSTLTKEKLNILNKYWVSQITMGLQSLEDDVLDNIWRLKHSYVSLDKLSILFKEYNFKLHFDFIIWLPWESIIEIEKAVRFIVTTFNPLSISINWYDNTIDTWLYWKYKDYFKSENYITNKRKNLDYIDNILQTEYKIERRKTFYFKNFYENHYNVIWIWAWSYWFIKWTGTYKNEDYIDYIKKWFTSKRWIQSNDFDERVMFIIHNYNIENFSDKYFDLFWENFYDNFKDKVDYFIIKWFLLKKDNKLSFNFKSKNIARFELINLYSNHIINLYN